MLEALIPRVYAVINIAQTVVAIPAGILSDKIGRKKVLLLGDIAVLTSALPIELPLNQFYIFPIALILGLYLGIWILSREQSYQDMHLLS